MAIETIDDATEQMNALAASYLEVLSALRTTPLGASTASDALVSTQSALTDARGLLDDLATVDETTLIAVEDGANLIRIWTWRREFRRAVLIISFDLTRLLERLLVFLQGVRIRVVFVTEGETLQSIAQRELGSFEAWPQLVAQNPGLSACDLQPGTAIVIPTRR